MGRQLLPFARDDLRKKLKIVPPQYTLRATLCLPYFNFARMITKLLSAKVNLFSIQLEKFNTFGNPCKSFGIHIENYFWYPCTIIIHYNKKILFHFGCFSLNTLIKSSRIGLFLVNDMQSADLPPPSQMAKLSLWS